MRARTFGSCIPLVSSLWKNISSFYPSYIVQLKRVYYSHLQFNSIKLVIKTVLLFPDIWCLWPQIQFTYKRRLGAEQLLYSLIIFANYHSSDSSLRSSLINPYPSPTVPSCSEEEGPVEDVDRFTGESPSVHDPFTLLNKIEKGKILGLCVFVWIS